MSRENQIMKIGALTEREYSWLKEHREKELTPHEKAKMSEYEDIKPQVELTDKKQRQTVVITKRLLWENFLIFFKHQAGKDFEQTPEAIKNIGPVINYFAMEDAFLKSENLIRRIENTELSPSFDKGLLIIGQYGCGKTIIFKTLAFMFNHYQMPMRFKFSNAHDLVSQWETPQNPGDRDLFFERYQCKALCIDDVKKERKASNYGITEIVRDIMERRYADGIKTFITCNYREGDSVGNIEDAVNEFGERYGGHIYDRILGNYNIIKFTGKSFRS